MVLSNRLKKNFRPDSAKLKAKPKKRKKPKSSEPTVEITRRTFLKILGATAVIATVGDEVLDLTGKRQALGEKIHRSIDEWFESDTPEDNHHPERQEDNRRLPNIQEEYLALTRDACRFFDMDESFIPLFVSIMFHESSFDTEARPRLSEGSLESNAFGLAQFLPDAFRDHASWFGPRLIRAGLISESDLFDGHGHGRNNVKLSARSNPLISIYFLASYTRGSIRRLVQNDHLSDRGLNSAEDADSINEIAYRDEVGTMLYLCHHEGLSGGQDSIALMREDQRRNLPLPNPDLSSADDPRPSGSSMNTEERELLRLSLEVERDMRIYRQRLNSSS